ncbi:type II toxin-antitoxin system RelE/ParE family toxin [Lonepinella sp. MS14437]|uniref:type II toxin-antitoxin system RelE/ParE family toxin n=1 Tax=unclassified Lonepinella TaxID=2642006 RepID=UPI0036DCB556
MKIDYNVVWLEAAEERLLKQVNYILSQSQNEIIAKRFYIAIKNDVEKLSYCADIYKRQRNKKIPVFDGKYIIRFTLDEENVYIFDFKSAKQNFH